MLGLRVRHVEELRALQEVELLPVHRQAHLLELLGADRLAHLVEDVVAALLLRGVRDPALLEQEGRDVPAEDDWRRDAGVELDLGSI